MEPRNLQSLQVPHLLKEDHIKHISSYFKSTSALQKSSSICILALCMLDKGISGIYNICLFITFNRDNCKQEIEIPPSLRFEKKKTFQLKMT